MTAPVRYSKICRILLTHIFQIHNLRTRLVSELSSLRIQEWRSVVGLEIHAQIKTKSKLFSGASTKFGAPTNSQVSHFDAALPGTLPVLNLVCVEAGVLTALALASDINHVCKFDRKHYFYADLPAGYQITQQRHPLAQNGHVNYVHITSGPGQKPVAEMRTCRLLQLQLEQDSGKSIHDHHDLQSLIDLNRAGIGLMELVTMPELKDGNDAASFVHELQMILQTIGTCDGKMHEGSLRVDANISVHRPGEPLGIRTEVKNINSIRNVCKAIDFEISRQIKILENGGQIENETRAFDAETNETVPMREKEKLLDYRFMPEPNLPPLRVYTNQQASLGKDLIIVVEDIQAQLVELPAQKRLRLQETYGVPLLSAFMLVNEDGLSELFESVMVNASHNLKAVLSVLLNEFIGVLRKYDCCVSQCPIQAESIGQVCDMLASRDISRETVYKLLMTLFENPDTNAKVIVEKNNWAQIRDRKLIHQIINQVIESDPKVMKRVQKGGSKAIMGAVQQKLDKRADPLLVTQIVQEIMERLTNK